ncbi:hypothetical protein DICPUDRAFT_154464 [Dictyostelium purpureum]|uniref:Uncharacterized protein n=1 Tax=Dictyostelium purpureum TaxID=5786 RepID=F0ZRE3_DICPU|nr:uncharacterized protein DICPUDRAFT_154464 [Dictyostelium purpureum]EGC33513.1 hypothetical protein DICPUDRAFT_154464 [Dictyostelium purpureum]|eukprot:XP_003289987.1 hypothetical protein DICPUDRAFT_154464 [Dictyostelium purpureum]
MNNNNNNNNNSNNELEEQLASLIIENHKTNNISVGMANNSSRPQLNNCRLGVNSSLGVPSSSSSYCGNQLVPGPRFSSDIKTSIGNSLTVPSIVVSSDEESNDKMDISTIKSSYINCNSKPNSSSNIGSCNIQQQQDCGMTEKEILLNQMKQKKIQSLERRDPSNVLVMENIDEHRAQLVQALVQNQNLNFSFSVQMVRYLSIFKSLILVFTHRNEAELCKLLVTRQDDIKLDSETKVYFGKEMPLTSLNKYQLATPFPSRQYLISPPLSPPNEWAPPGDGMESAPNDSHDPFAVVSRVTIDSSSIVSDSNSSHETPSSLSPPHSVDQDQLNDRLKKIIFQDTTNNNLPSITLEFCT